MLVPLLGAIVAVVGLILPMGSQTKKPQPLGIEKHEVISEPIDYILLMPQVMSSMSFRS